MDPTIYFDIISEINFSPLKRKDNTTIIVPTLIKFGAFKFSMAPLLPTPIIMPPRTVTPSVLRSIIDSSWRHTAILLIAS